MDVGEDPFEQQYLVEMAMNTPRKMVTNLTNKREGNITEGKIKRRAKGILNMKSQMENKDYLVKVAHANFEDISITKKEIGLETNRKHSKQKQ